MASNNKLLLGKCEYDPETRTVITESHPPQIIGHVQAKLLQLLYSSPNVYFSNEDLQREVWDGRFIENTTIRTTVSYLRKALGESETCKYIDSGRNKGYRFVAEIEEITPERQIKRFFPFAIIAALIVLLVYVVQHTNVPQVIPTTETTLVGQEIEAVVAGSLMVFSHKPEGSKYWNIYSKNIGKERYFRLTDGAFNDRNVALSDDGNKLAFNRHDGIDCEIIVAKLTKAKQELSEVRKVFNCPDEVLSVSIAWKDSSSLYLSYSTSLSKRYAIYLFNFETEEITSVVPPIVSGRGDYFVSRNEQAKKVAYLRNVIGTKTEVWVFDESTNESSKVISIPLILMSIGWMDADTLVIRTGHGQLSLLNIHSKQLSLLFETENTISFPYVINNNTVGFMNGFLAVKDIIRLEPDGRSQNVISSSFGDYSPVYAEASKKIAFISNRTGKNQIWLLNDDGELLQVTRFESYLKIGNLTISEDGAYIAFVINGHLQIMGTDGSTLFKSKERHLYKNPVFSKDSKMVYYASNIDGDWFIESRLMSHLNEKKKITEGYVIKPCNQPNCFYFIKNNESVLNKFDQGGVEITGILLSNITSPEQLAIIDEQIFYLNRAGGRSELLKKNMLTKEVTSVMPMTTTRFSVQKEPFRVYTSIYREPDTFLQSIEIKR